LRKRTRKDLTFFGQISSSRVRPNMAIAIVVVAALVACRRKTNDDAVHADDPRPIAKHAARSTLHRGDPRVAQIETTSLGICARREDGRVSCWLQYGVDLDVDETSKPRELDVRDVVQLAGGWAQFCALHEDGTVTCWGGDGHVRIDGTLWDAPKKVDGVRDAVEITAGESHACARIADGSVLCWGSNAQGQLGDGKRADF